MIARLPSDGVNEDSGPGGCHGNSIGSLCAPDGDRLRLAFVIPTLDQSGAERQMTLLATELSRLGADVRVFALNRGGPWEESLNACGIPVTVLGKRFRFDVLTWLRLRRAMRKFQPHIVQSWLFAANTYVRLPGIVPKGTRVIVSERCVDSWKSGWQIRLDRLLASRMDAMTANSRSVAEFYSGIGIASERITVIPNAIPQISDLPGRDQARRQLGLESQHRVVGFTGRLAPQKRLRDLLWGFQLLHQLVENARLVLIGAGPERDRLAEIAESFGCRDRIVFAGHRTDAYQLMQAFDVFALASEFEGMSNSLMEAMNLGLPCVVSDIPANRELVVHDQTGLLFPSGNCPELAGSLARILKDAELSRRLGDAARRQMTEDHSVQQMVDRHRTLYERVLTSGIAES